MAVLSHEGTYSIMYGSLPLPIGSTYRTGYMARPDVAGKFPVVIVLPSVDGLTGMEKDLCRRLARAGIAAIAIDSYREAPEDPLAAYAALTDERALTDLDEVHEFVASEDVTWAASSDVGMLGIDVGGRFGLIRAATREWVKSLVLAYTPLTGDDGRSHQVADYLSNLPIPVLALYGADDELIVPESVDEAQRRNDHGQWLLYSDVGHGFLDVESPGFDQSASDDAIARMIAFFKATLAASEEIDLG